MSDVVLRENERIDDLEINGFRIIQNPFCFCFGIDAVMLANFARIKKNAKVLDMGTGTGIIPILLAAKGKGSDWTGLEVQSEMVEMARRSTELNDISHVCHIMEGDIKDYKSLFKHAEFGAVTCNPPYMKANSGLTNPSDNLYISRHEALVSLEEIIAAASYVLKSSGTFSMVHRPYRLVEIMTLMRKHHIEPKRLQMVQPSIGKEPNLILIEGVKGAGVELRVLPTFYVYDENGNMNDVVGGVG
ncbi:MAG: tRNA1(Val) (adenine(37)-N6)-methyltransferase [Eubacterium sp.]|nr:tRNA1(Val) (adenine(37)-N6)-methyltransferase [Eubacterium sp.]